MLKVETKFCKGCGICVVFCPKEVLKQDNSGKVYIDDINKCVKCGLCEIRCPEFAITVDTLGEDTNHG